MLSEAILSNEILVGLIYKVAESTVHTLIYFEKKNPEKKKKFFSWRKKFEKKIFFELLDLRKYIERLASGGYIRQNEVPRPSEAFPTIRIGSEVEY